METKSLRSFKKTSVGVSKAHTARRSTKLLRELPTKSLTPTLDPSPSRALRLSKQSLPSGMSVCRVNICLKPSSRHQTPKTAQLWVRSRRSTRQSTPQYTTWWIPTSAGAQAPMLLDNSFKRSTKKWKISILIGMTRKKTSKMTNTTIKDKSTVTRRSSTRSICHQSQTGDSRT